jgi:hypothetical protein
MDIDSYMGKPTYVSQSILSVYSDVCMSVLTAQYDVSNRHRQCILSGGVRTGTPEHSV